MLPTITFSSRVGGNTTDHYLFSFHKSIALSPGPPSLTAGLHYSPQAVMCDRDGGYSHCY